jgi:protein tyrosine phosphatase
MQHMKKLSSYRVHALVQAIFSISFLHILLLSYIAPCNLHAHAKADKEKKDAQILSIKNTYTWQTIEEELSTFSTKIKGWLQQQDIAVENIRTQYEDRKTLSKTFYKLEKYCQTIYSKKTTLEASRKINKDKNRNKMLVPYDISRSLRDIKEFYINGNDIVTPYQEYFATQGPLTTTIKDFWQAVLHKKSSLILALVMPSENGTKKCEAYWEEEYFPFTHKEWIIDVTPKVQISSMKIDDQIISMRFFFCQNMLTGENRMITHLHYENWKDQDVPNLNLFKELLVLIDIYNPNSSPVTVHCSAGVGRTGTLIAAHALRKQLLQNKKEKVVNIPKMILALRLQRRALVSTKEQLALIYRTVSDDSFTSSF